MNKLRQLGNFWILRVTTIVLACFSDAVAQTSYKVIDLGVVNDKDNFSCAMDHNNFGWTWQRCAAGRMRATSTPFWQPL